MNTLFKKIFILYSFLLGLNLVAGGCCCIPEVSCIGVRASLTISTNMSKEGISLKDSAIGITWENTVENHLSDIKKYQNEMTNERKKINAIQNALLVENLKEEYFYTVINKVNDVDSQYNGNEAQLLLLESQLDLMLNNTAEVNRKKDNALEELLGIE